MKVIWLSNIYTVKLIFFCLKEPTECTWYIIVTIIVDGYTHNERVYLTNWQRNMGN